MKRLIFISICYLLLIENINGQCTLTIHQIKAKGDTIPELIIANYEDSCLVKKNDSTLVFTINPSQPDYLMIAIDLRTKPRWTTRLWINPKIKHREIVIDYSKKTVKIKNKNEWDKILEKMAVLEKKGNDNQSDSIAIAFIKKNPESYLSLWFLTHGIARDNRSEKLNLFKKLSPELKTYPEYGQLKADLTGRKYPNLGDTFKEFILNDKNDNVFNSSAVNKKWILLNFWSNGCGPCVREMDAFVEFYKSIDTSKAEFISIALDENQNIWKNGKATDKIIWPSVWTTNNVYCDLCLNYNVYSMPFFILFDNEKKIFFIKDGSNELENIKTTFKEKNLLK